MDNCEFGKGEKETTTMDLTGFWEMIYIQVLDSNIGPNDLKVSSLALKMQVEDDTMCSTSL